MKFKSLMSIFSFILIFLCLSFSVSAATEKYTVLKGDSLWKIAVKYEVGLSEIIDSNPQFKNPNLIYPGDVVSVPLKDTAVTSYEQQVIDLINQIRVENSLMTLSANWQLSRVARIKSQDMKDNNYFSHTSPVYGTPSQMIKNFGIAYRTSGENIAYGYSTPKAVVDAWMNSSGHRANILNPSYTQIGVGYVASGNYWTQMFIG